MSELWVVTVLARRVVFLAHFATTREGWALGEGLAWTAAALAEELLYEILQSPSFQLRAELH